MSATGPVGASTASLRSYVRARWESPKKNRRVDRLIQIDSRAGPDIARGRMSVKITLVQVSARITTPIAIPSPCDIWPPEAQLTSRVRWPGNYVSRTSCRPDAPREEPRPAERSITTSFRGVVMNSTVAEPGPGQTGAAELDAYSRVVTSVAAELTSSVA